MFEDYHFSENAKIKTLQIPGHESEALLEPISKLSHL
jgi:hypothetical protein